MACFAALWVQRGTSTRKLKKGPVTADFYAFLTCAPNAEVGAIHPKAMPVILTTAEEVETWMTATWDVAKALQWSLSDGALKIAARGEKMDEVNG